jgi:phosphoglycolate phosphatase
VTAGSPAGAGRPVDHRPDWLLAGVDLAIFDKDGTLIDFHGMWSDWVRELDDRLSAGLGGRRLDPELRAILGVDAVSGRVLPHGALAATPMARLRDMVLDAVEATGLAAAEAERLVASAWQAPDPIATAQPLADLPELFRGLARAGMRIAVATSDDRVPTERTLDHLGIAGFVAAVTCADDGLLVKPHPDAVVDICHRLGVPAARTALIGDSPADLAMGRAARVGRVIGVLTGVGDVASLGPLADALIGSVSELRPAR